MYAKLCVKFCDALKSGANMSYFKEGLKIRGIQAGNMRKPSLNIESAEIQRYKKELAELCEQADISLTL